MGRKINIDSWFPNATPEELEKIKNGPYAEMSPSRYQFDGPHLIELPGMYPKGKPPYNPFSPRYQHPEEVGPGERDIIFNPISYMNSPQKPDCKTFHPSCPNCRLVPDEPHICSGPIHEEVDTVVIGKDIARNNKLAWDALAAVVTLGKGKLMSPCILCFSYIVRTITYDVYEYCVNWHEVCYDPKTG